MSPNLTPGARVEINVSGRNWIPGTVERVRWVDRRSHVFQRVTVRADFGAVFRSCRADCVRRLKAEVDS